MPDHQRRLRERLATGRSTATLLNRADHGTHRCYSAGCRCDPCTDAETALRLANKRRSREGA